MRSHARFATVLVGALVLPAVIRAPDTARAAVADTDGDGVSDAVEDLDGDGDGSNDDTDGDDLPNRDDPDDDGDGIRTRNEDANENGDPTDDFSDLFGVDEPDYLNWNVPLDRDYDTYVAVEFGGDDCADDRAGIHPDIGHDPLYDGEDWDCDGGEFEFDGDRDGYDSRVESPSGDDCNDYDPTVHPGATEGFEDGRNVDRDCDGWLDPVGTLVPDGGCDCGSTGSPAGAALALLARAAAARRRR